MKKLLILCSALLCTAFSAHAASVETDDTKTILSTPVTLPDETRLNAIICDISQHLAQRSNIVKTFAGKTMSPLGVCKALDCCINDYVQGMPIYVSLSIGLHVPSILEGILEEHPDAIRALKNSGTIK